LGGRWCFTAAQYNCQDVDGLVQFSSISPSSSARSTPDPGEKNPLAEIIELVYEAQIVPRPPAPGGKPAGMRDERNRAVRAVQKRSMWRDDVNGALRRFQAVVYCWVVPLSRRRFLGGAGIVAVAVGAGGGVIDVVDHSLIERGLRRIGLASSPDRRFSPSGAEERSGTLTSRYVASAPGWTVSTPPGTDPVRGIIFCLHGYHGNHRMAFDEIHVPDVAASVGLRVAVAAVDGGPDSYWHKRTDGDDPLSMLLQEFVPLVRQMVGDVPQALMGWSMGGYGALLAAERDRAGFVAVAPASPALWLSPGSSAPGAFDGPADFYANDVFTDIALLQGMAIAVACGTGDPFYNATRDLVSRMDYSHAAFFGPGFHDDAYWRSVAESQLRTFLPVLG
jgi:dienelactone hydrolase